MRLFVCLFAVVGGRCFILFSGLCCMTDLSLAEKKKKTLFFCIEVMLKSRLGGYLVCVYVCVHAWSVISYQPCVTVITVFTVQCPV